MPAKATKDEQTSIRLTSEAMSRLRAYAALEGRSMGNAVERWIMSTLPPVKGRTK